MYYLANHIRNPGDSTLPDLPYPAACIGRGIRFPHAHNNSLVRERVDLLLELTVYGRDRRATDTRTVEVLEGREEGRDTRLLVCLRVASGEGRGDGRVVDHVAGVDVRVQRLRFESISMGNTNRSGKHAQQ